MYKTLNAYAVYDRHGRLRDFVVVELYSPPDDTYALDALKRMQDHVLKQPGSVIRHFRYVRDTEHAENTAPLLKVPL